MIFIGIDVSERRGCAWVALSKQYAPIEQGWVQGDATPEGTARDMLEVVEKLGSPDDIVVAIDAPRMPLPARRTWSYSQPNGWQQKRPVGGRHCELVIRTLRLANPQWTPLVADARPWMAVGFALFRVLAKSYKTLEVFPSASYHQLEKDKKATIQLSFAQCANGPKDMLDAYVAAYTAGEFIEGRGCQVGGGDGLGAIVLPKAIAIMPPGIDEWPEGR